MNAKEFDYDGFLKFAEEKEDTLQKFMAGKISRPLFTQSVVGDAYGFASTRKESSLEAWLENMTVTTKLHADVAYAYIQPWLGVAVYANAFGAKLFWSDKTDVQSRCCYMDVSEVANVPVPDPKKCELMQMVMEYIRYFKEQTHGLLPMCLTDTQSPCDTASLVLDACEYFAAAKEEPEMLFDFMEKITRCTIDFTEMQMEAIGENLVRPGHEMISGRSLKGIALSDDNMAFISPETYDVICWPWNERISRHFGGVAIHSCGVVSHNLEKLRQTEGLQYFNFKITDFEPNDAALLAKTFSGTDVVLNPCVYPQEDLSRLVPLFQSGVKVIVNVFTSGSPDEMNRQYDAAVEKMMDFC